jgi:hypothetical protein
MNDGPAKECRFTRIALGLRDNEAKADFLAAFAPGMPPRIVPEGAAKLVPAGSTLMFQVHDTPKGTPQTDRSEIGLTFADPKSIRREMTAISAINMNFKVPAGESVYAPRCIASPGMTIHLPPPTP